jgi:signal transduction histidine kinase
VKTATESLPRDSGAFALDARALSPLAAASVLALVTVAYVVAGKLGLLLAIVHKSATAVWPPTGIALAAVLMLGYWVAPAIAIGAFVVNVATESAAVSAGIAVGNTLEALIGAYLVKRFAAGHFVFEQPQTTFRFAFLAGLLAPAVSASVGVASLVLGGAAQASAFGPIWLTWWLGDAAGAVLVAPCVLLWAGNPYPSWPPRQLLEGLLLVGALVVVGWLVFVGWPAPGADRPLEFLCIPLVLWAAFRFGRREASAAAILLSGIAIWGTFHGSGPFAGYSENQSLLLLQAYMGAIAVMGVSIAAVVADDARVREALQRLNQELERRVTQRTEQLRAANAELSRSNVELERFAHVASHDMREPLRKIASYTELLAERYRGRLDAEAEELIAYALDAADRMQKLLDDLLAYSRVGSRPYEAQPTDAGAVLKTVISDLDVSIRYCGAAITADPLPLVLADQIALGQLFLNLISNALKFRTEAPPAVHVSAERRGDAWEFCVSDNGIGIPKEHRERVFAMFERLHARGKYPGSGMGLAICRKIVERHGGRIWVDSAGAGGCEVKFTLKAPAD